MLKHKKLFLPSFLAVVVLSAAAWLAPERGRGQGLAPALWQAIDERQIARAGERVIVPRLYRTLRLDLPNLRSLLAAAPLEFTAAARASETVLQVPMPDGRMSRFRVEESPVMEPGLAARAPDIKTYRGQGIDDPTATARFDVTPAGFHAIVLSASDTVYVDPYAKGDSVNYISYFKRDLAGGPHYECRLGDFDAHADSAAQGGEASAAPAAAGPEAGVLRTYRLALAVTGEYTMYFSELLDSEETKKQKALAALTTTLNRVNGIYERDLSVRMVLVADQMNIIYTNPAVDPYQSDMVYGLTMLYQNQANLDLPKPAGPVGEGNYDIGHVMSTGFGGIAALESVCDRGSPSTPGDGSNAQGFTGLDTPVGDPFDVDFVAHEMGHQFGGNHTFNGSDGSCGGNESSGAAMEPGSGTTIQAYAGICATQDLQPHSDDYFHVRSLEEMSSFVRGDGLSFGGDGDSCSTKTPVDNRAPAVDAGPDHTVPRDTPFALTAAGSDPDGDALTYTWEEYDLGPASPAGSNTDNDDGGVARPVFRSYKGTTDPARTFPSMRYVLENANRPPATYDCGRGAADPCITGEDLPSMTRTMKFKVTARDNRAAGGGYATDLVEVNVRAEAGPFRVTAPNGPTAWAANTTRTVTWDVANTHVAPVSASSVRIKLSVDGGRTFPYVLADNTPNDGSEQVAVPNAPTARARLRIEAVGNVFFDVSDADFTVSFDESACVTNYALASAGATATASSVYDARNYAPAGVIDGDRTGANWERGGGWNDATRGAYPDWLEVHLGGPRSISLVRVYTLADNYLTGAGPTAATTAALYGLVDYDIQYWDGSTWVTPPGGAVRANNLAVRAAAFPAVVTDRVRVRVHNARQNFSRVVEVEAFGCGGAP